MTVLAVAVVGVLVAAVLAAPSLLRPTPDAATPRRGTAPPAAPEPTSAHGAAVPSVGRSTGPADTEREQALVDLLARRAEALLVGDRQAWLAGVDPQAPAFRERQAAVFDAARQLPLEKWTYRLGADRPRLSQSRRPALGADAWIAEVLLRYRVAGFDAVDVQRRLYLTVVLRDGRWWVAEDADGTTSGKPSDRDIWDHGPVQVASGTSSLVVGQLPAVTLAAYAAEADRAVAAVDDIWTQKWPRRVLLYAPATVQQMAELTQLPAAGLSQLAAVTAGRADPGRRARGDRIILNPAAFAGLVPTARRVVLAHETAHVATRAMRRTAVPLWLAEGFADYVGYRGTGVPVRVAAAAVIGRIRSGDGPTALPTAAEFDAAKGDVSPAYNGAWLACRLIAQRSGEAALVALYVQASAGPDGLAQGLRRLGTDERRLTADWLEYLEGMAA